MIAIQDYTHNSVAWQTTDALGSVIAQTDATAHVDHFNIYHIWGNLQSGSLSDDPGYAKLINDTNTGLSYAQQRYYDPIIPSFLSMDPVDVDPDTGTNFNRYAYANDNPYRFIDRDGRLGADRQQSTDEKSCEAFHCWTYMFSAPETQTVESTFEAGSVPWSFTMLASNSNDSVQGEEARNAARAFADAYTALVEHGVIGSRAASLLVEVGARAVSAGDQAYNVGMFFAGTARNTLEDAPRDIDFYIQDDRRGPTGGYYPTSWINWGRVDWRPFDPGLDNSTNQIWLNFLMGAQLYNRDGRQ